MLLNIAYSITAQIRFMLIQNNVVSMPTDTPAPANSMAGNIIESIKSKAG